MTDFEGTDLGAGAEPDTVRDTENDSAVGHLPGPADETGVERGSADGSAQHNQVRDDSLRDAASEADVESQVPEAEAYESLTPETAESGQDNGLSQ